MINWINKILNKLFPIDSVEVDENKKVFYKKIITKSTTPTKDQLAENDFVEVVYKKKSYWAIFKCPCGCHNLISLPLQNTHAPHWTLTHSRYGRPTVHPSIWQNKGCFSHFWINDGKISWCNNSGIEPWIAEPKFYKIPLK